MPLGTRDILLLIRAKDQASRVIADVGRSVDLLGRNATNSGKLTGAQMQRIGQTIIGVGLAIGAAGAAGVAFFWDATKAAMAYDKQARLTLTQVEDTKIQLEDIKRVGREVALAIPAPFEQMQEGLYDIFSSIDVNLAQSQTLLTAFAKAAVTGNTDIQTAGRATIAILNAFKIPAEQVSRVMDVQFQVVRKGVITYEEFARSIGRAIPSAVKAGQSIEDLGGMMAFLTRNGLSAAMAATSSARALDLLANPKFASRMREIGISVFDANGQFRPMSQVMQDLGQKMKELPIEQRAQAMAELTKGAGGVIQAMRFVNLAIADQIGLAAGEIGMLQQMTEWMYNAAGAMEKGYDIMRQTPEVQIQAFKNSVGVLKTEIGDGLLPIVSKLAAKGVELIAWFRDIDPHTKRMIAQFGLFTSVSLLVIGAVTALAGGVVMFLGIWRQLNTALAITTHIQLIPAYFQQWAAQAKAAATSTTALGTALRFAFAASVVLGAILLIQDGINRYQTAVDGAKKTWGDFIDEVRHKVPPADQMDVLTDALDRQKAKLEELKKPWYEITILSKEGLFPDLAKIAATEQSIEQLSAAIEEGVGSTEMGKKAYESLTLAFGEEAAAAMKASAETEEAFVKLGEDAEKMRDSIVGAIRDSIDVIAEFGESATATAGDLEKFYTDQVRQAENFYANIEKALAKGVDPAVLQRALEAGPAAAAAFIEKLAADNAQALIDTVNRGEASVATLEQKAGQALAAVLQAQQAVDNLGGTTATPTLNIKDDDFSAKHRAAEDGIRSLDGAEATSVARMNNEDFSAKHRAAEDGLTALDGAEATSVFKVNHEEYVDKYNDSKDKIGDLNRASATSLFKAVNPEVVSKYNDSKDKIGDLNRSVSTSLFKANHSDLTTKYGDSKGKIVDMGRTHSMSFIRGDAGSVSSAVADARRWLSGIAGSVWTTYINVVRRYSPFSDGGFIPPSRFANGSEDHRAQVASAGAWRVWAEPETGGEAYIPLATSKRRQSELILSLVANSFGYGLYPLDRMVAAAEGRLMSSLRSSVPAIRITSGSGRSSATGSYTQPHGPSGTTIYQGDTFNIYTRSDSPEEVVAGVSFRKKTRGW